MNMISVIKSLNRKRPIFHSEKDFQFALAWEIKSIYPDSQIRLEVPFRVDGACGSIDIIAIYNNNFYPIELKYKQAEFETVIDNERYNLTKHIKHTDSPPEFIGDIERVEKLSASLNDGKKLGFTIWITNDNYYWDTKQIKNGHAPFFVCENARINGKMKNSVERHKNVEISGNYTVHWNDYYDFKNKNGRFRYALIEIQ